MFTLPIIFVASCFFPKKNKENSYADKLKLMETDRAFSKMSEEKGMKSAFLEYIDSNGVLLRENSLPLLGADAVDYLIQQNDSDYVMRWEPKSGIVSKSGDLGYTYGVYTVLPIDIDTVIYGTYVSIWKKQKDGNWKFVLDAGNNGIGE